MSYARFNPSDVYVYMDVNGTLCCCMCLLEPYDVEYGCTGSVYFDSTQAMVDHLELHRDGDHHVPDIEPALWADDEDNFPPGCREGHDWNGEPYQPYPQHPTVYRVRCQRCDWETSLASARADAGDLS